MHSQNIQSIVLQTIERHRMLCAGDSVLVAISGGADSVALLYLLLGLQEEKEFTLFAGHVNHGIRVQESQQEEAFVRRLCKQWQVPLFVKQLHMVESDNAQTVVSEEKARDLRHSFLRSLAQEHGAKIATGHTGSDNAQTVLFHAVRGSFTGGLSGILPHNGQYIRPLLALSRKEVRCFCKGEGLAYCNDSSNENMVYTRNFVRTQVMPKLEKVHGGAEKNLQHLAEDMQELHAYLKNEALALLDAACTKAKKTEKTQGWYLPSYDADVLRQAPAPVRRQALALLAGPSVTREHLKCMEAVLQEERAGVQLPGGACVRLQGTRYIHRAENTEGNVEKCFPLQEGSYDFGPYQLCVSLISQDMFLKELESFQKKDYIFFADYDKIYQSCIFRTRCRGDIFRPAGRGLGKSVKKWMQEAGIDREVRGRLPLLAEPTLGAVLWIYGAGFAQGLAVQADTKRVLRIETNYR